jgi:hypothetical protein
MRRSISDNLIVFLIVVGALAAAWMMDSLGMPQKWHAAVIWTGAALTGSILVFRKRWARPTFWIALVTCFAVHIFAMWLIFQHLLSSISFVGMLYAIPLALVEGGILLAAIPWVERCLAD